MATILQLDRRLRDRRKASPPQEGAMIVIFPGVRYERWSQPEETPPIKRRRGQKRKSLNPN